VVGSKAMRAVIDLKIKNSLPYGIINDNMMKDEFLFGPDCPNKEDYPKDTSPGSDYVQEQDNPFIGMSS